MGMNVRCLEGELDATGWGAKWLKPRVTNMHLVDVKRPSIPEPMTVLGRGPVTPRPIESLGLEPTGRDLEVDPLGPELEQGHA